ncbi:aminopeptidase N-like [Rhagoletis pomonella]|uniref:aminopeptidase N-like n=1 Tax=Rhagoletis pomonella TaxID=28610 RepID=UPI001785072C|nr:aminopeptidase N-like [Rhagoletis pomonella]
MYDAYRFVNNDRLDISILLRLFTYLPGEDQYAPWTVAASVLTTYNSYLSGNADYSEFKAFVGSLVSNIYEKLGVNEPAGEQFLRKFTRNTVVNLACLVGVENCLTDANDKLKSHINNGVDIEPNLRSQAYCNGLRQASNSEYTYFLNDLLSSSDTTHRTRLLSALGCSQNEAQLQSFVSSSINLGNSLTSSERTSILSAAYSRSPLGLLVSIDFLGNNWDAYSNLSNSTGSSNPLSRDIVSMGSYVNNATQQEQLLALVDKVKNSAKVQTNLEEAVNANIKVNFDWIDKNGGQVISFVKTYRSNGSAALSASLMSALMAVLLTLSRFL